MKPKRINAYLVCGGEYHDMDFARLELLKLLAEHPNVRVKVGSDYSDIKTIVQSDFLITYTCNVLPDANQAQVLKAWLSEGHRWFALHGTNSVCRFLSLDPVCVGTPRESPLFMEMLGSQFLAHPPISEYKVHVTNAGHPLTRGISDFTTCDELYLSEFHGEHECLLHTFFNGTADDFDEGKQWQNDEPRPVMYLHPYHQGQVLYLTLGHCRGTYDMQPLVDEYPNIERCSWELDVYYLLLRRGIEWCMQGEADA